jgi:glycosyltransferase involved in cell wall biosynthesis
MGWLRRGFEGYDLYHAPADLVPLGLRCPWVVTVHDLMWVEAPKLASSFLPVRWANGLWYRSCIGYSIRGANAVIAISQATKDAIERVYVEHGQKTHVIHHGIDRNHYDVDNAGPREALDRFLPSSQRYSLIVGQGSPYKNHAAMIRAFVEATRDEPDHKLLLVRRFTRIDFDMQRLLARPEVKAKTIALPFVTDRELLTLYVHAHMLLFASHYEGFGLPALEAMALGTAVLGSTAPAVQEITGDGALHATPHDLADLTEKIRRLASDDALRAKLIEAGAKRVASFQWARCADQTLAVYRRALGQHESTAPHLAPHASQLR